MKRVLNIIIIIMLLLSIVLVNRVYAVENIKGDLNGDGRVSALDLSMLKAYIVKLEEYEDLSNFDVNMDTKINVVDISILKLKLVGLYVESQEDEPSHQEDEPSHQEDEPSHQEDEPNYQIESLGQTEPISSIEKEKIKNYINRYAKFVEYFSFVDSSEVDLLLDRYDELLDSPDKHSREDINSLMLMEEYLYEYSEEELGVSDEKINELADELGYKLINHVEDEVVIGGNSGHLSTINKIKENYYDMFGKTMPEKIIQDLKNSKDYVEEYDAMFYVIAEGITTGHWYIDTIADIVKQGEFYNLKIEYSSSNITYVTLKKVNENYYFVSIGKEVNDENSPLLPIVTDPTIGEDITDDEKLAFIEFFNGTTPGSRIMAQFVLTFEFNDSYEIENENLLLDYLCKPCEAELGVTTEKLAEIGKKLGYEEMMSMSLGSEHLVTIDKIKENYRLMFGKEIKDSIINNLKNSEAYLVEYDAIYWINAITCTGIFEIKSVEGKRYEDIYRLILTSNGSEKIEVILKKEENSYSYVSIQRMPYIVG